MNEQEDFFSKNHGRLMDIALWSKYAAWIVLVVYILNTGGFYIQEQYRLRQTGVTNLTELLSRNLGYAFNLIIGMASVFVKGVVYFLVLKGISLGLNMIIETDLNYREPEKEAGAVQK